MSWNIKTPGDYINGPLTVAGAVTLNSDLTVVNNITCNSEIYSLGGRLALYRTAGASYVDWSSGQNLIWRTVTSVGGGGAANQMWLNSTGLGVGTTPTQRLTVSGNISLTNSAATSIGLTNATSGITYTLFSASPSGNGFTGFGIYDGSAYIMRTNQQGDFGVGVLPDNTKSACLQLKSGISFPATQSASTDANTLDDYEEGTFTPVIIGTTTAGVGTYANQVGRYTKIGNLVTVQVFLNWTAHTGTGDMRVSGLPFLTDSTAGLYGGAAFGWVNNITVSAGYILSGYTLESSVLVNLQQLASGGGAAQSVPIDPAGGMIFTLSYRAS